MTKPMIRIVDDDAAELVALRDANARRFGADYGVSAHGSATAALERLASWGARGGETALVIADG